ncbi:MAG: methyl-accepting chemotaxis protein [Spirochaetes bacterium]|nr:methyl-accepting chemotaxis protein [Spirochaetota bacterium]
MEQEDKHPAQTTAGSIKENKSPNSDKSSPLKENDLTQFLGDIYNVITQYMMGNYAARVNPASLKYPNQQFSDLAKIINQTGEKTGERIAYYSSGINDMVEILDKIQQGDPSLRILKDYKNPGLLKLKHFINSVLDQRKEKDGELTNIRSDIDKTLPIHLEIMRQIKAGSLNMKAPETAGSDQIANLGKAINDVIALFKDLVVRMKTRIKNMNSSLQKISESLQSDAGRFSEPKKVIDGASSSVQQISEMTAQLDKGAGDLLKMAHHLDTMMEKTTDIMDQFHSLMSDIQNHYQLNSSRVNNIFQDIHLIKESVATVYDVSHITGILSINASIQAEKIGEPGRDLSVVTDEIRGISRQVLHLATKARKASDEMEATIQTLLDLNASQVDMINNEVELSASIKETFQDIKDYIRNSLISTAKQVSSFALKQAPPFKQITDSFKAMADSAGKAKQVSQNEKEKIQILAGHISELEKDLERFKTENRVKEKKQ